MKKTEIRTDRTDAERGRRAKEGLLKILYHICRKISDRVEDVLFHFYFVNGGNREEI